MCDELIISPLGGQGFERWANVEVRFYEDTLVLNEKGKIHGDKKLLHMPTMPHEAFDQEVKKWTSQSYDNDVCNMRTQFTVLVDVGADYSTYHPGKALHCWMYALQKSKDANLLSVVTSNIKIVRERQFFQYKAVMDVQPLIERLDERDVEESITAHEYGEQEELIVDEY